MFASIVFAEGAPCPTVVLPAASLPASEAELSVALRAAHHWLKADGLGHVLKVALIAPSSAGDLGLDYRFVQLVPGAVSSCEFRGSCGHSLLGGIMVASRLGWLPDLKRGCQVRVNVLNNDDTVVCRLDEIGDGVIEFTVAFEQKDAPRLADMLLFDEPTIEIEHPVGRINISAVSCGNPYVFVNAADLGRSSESELFADDEEFFGVLSGIRTAAERRLGWAPGVFPKVAAILPDARGSLLARAITVPSWHPSLALTGITSLTAASMIPGTLPAVLAQPAGHELVIRTPGGEIRAEAKVAPDQIFESICVGPKVVTFIREVDILALDNSEPRAIEVGHSERMVTMAAGVNE